MKFSNTGWVALAAVLGGSATAAAQQPEPVRIDPGQVAEQLQLTPEVQREIGPALEELNELFASDVELWARNAELQEGFASATETIAQNLTQEQWYSFRMLLMSTWRQSLTNHHGSAMGYGMHGSGGAMGSMGSHGSGMPGDGMMSGMGGSGAGSNGHPMPGMNGNHAPGAHMGVMGAAQSCW